MYLATPFVSDRRGQYVTPGAAAQPNRPATLNIVIHHAAATYAPGAACDKIWQYHAGRWPAYGRIGYHEIIQVENVAGALLACLVNPPEMIGAGVYGKNDTCYHICAATNFTGMPDPMWIEALALRAAEALRRWPHARLVGHKDIALPTNQTACPGAFWLSWQPILQHRVNQLLADFGSYEFIIDQAAFADWQLSRPAPTPEAPHYWRRGEQVQPDAIEGNVAHAGPEGFVPLGALRKRAV